MNFTGLNLDLQGVMRRTYANLYYQSTFMNFLDESFMEVTRQTGTPMIEVIKQTDTVLNKRVGAEITSALSNSLATYDSVKVDLTQLAMDYSFRISPVILGANIQNTLEGQMKLKESQIAFAIDQFGYDKFNTKINGTADGSMAYTNGQCVIWAPADATATITLLNTLKSTLFNRKVYDSYRLGLVATEYANFVSALTSILKYETRAGVEGVDRGMVGVAYGIDTFEINDNAVKDPADNSATNIKGFFANQIGAVGDMYFSSMAQYLGNYPGFPGYYVLEGNILFGAEVVRPEAIIKLVGSLPTMNKSTGKGTFDAGTVGSSYSQTTAFNGTNIASFVAVGLPAGLSLNASSGAVTGTPTVAGSYSVSVYGLDTYGNMSDIQTGTIVISPASA